MRRSVIRPVGKYLIQYTDMAGQQAENLDESSRNAVQEKVHMVASLNPYAHGVQVEGIRDRRSMRVQDIDVLFWVSVSSLFKVITVVKVERNNPMKRAPRRTLYISAEPPSGFEDFVEDATDCNSAAVDIKE